MSIYLSIFVIIICLFSFFKQREIILLWFFVFTIINGMFEFNFGAAFKVYHLITLLYLPRTISFLINSPTLKRKVNPLMIEFILMMAMGLLFSFVIQFDDPFKHFRSTTQLPEWRTLISGIRLFLELFSVLTVIYWLKVKLFSVKYLFKVISVSTIITVVFAFLIYITNGVAYKFVFPYWDYVADRMLSNHDFRGLVGEPKTFGRTCAFLLISMLSFGKYIDKPLRIFSISLSFIGILMSMSASALIVASVGLFLFFVTQKKISYLLIFSVVFLVLFQILNSNSNFNEKTLGKIRYVLSSNSSDRIDEGKVRSNEPEVFTRFEIFDRAALNFLYFNPQYLLFGVGPNTVSIPASQYLTYRMRNSEVHGYGINTAPATLFVNILSRSGLLGLFLYLFFLFGVYRGLRGRNFKNTFLILTIMAFITSTTIILLFHGIFLFLSIYNRKYNFKKRLIHSNEE